MSRISDKLLLRSTVSIFDAMAKFKFQVGCRSRGDLLWRGMMLFVLAASSSWSVSGQTRHESKTRPEPCNVESCDDD